MLQTLVRPLLIPILRRDPGEVDVQARLFHIESEEGRGIVSGVGHAFLDGYNTMLQADELQQVNEAAFFVEPHFRPFFFEGAAMGYLPRAYFTKGVGQRRVESDLLTMDPRFRYLYYVGLGFWYGFRHRRNPGALENLAAHIDPMYFPLCYDGFGFKLGFFDFPSRGAAVRRILESAPPVRRYGLYQGFGRALHFVYMDDEEGFRTERTASPREHRNDVEFGRSLALAFTGLRRPERITKHIMSARDDDERDARELGTTWALTAREMNDPDHFERCLQGLGPAEQAWMRRLPRLCHEALKQAKTYRDWQARTTTAIKEARSR